MLGNWNFLYTGEISLALFKFAILKLVENEHEW